MPDEIVISVKHVSKNFVLPHEKVSTIKGLFTGSIKKKKSAGAETQHALEDINFEIKKGEFFGIVGRNGSGKSTLLKILAGIYQPTEGSISTIGKLVPFIELGVGFNPELTGRENVYLNGALIGFSRTEIDAMYQDIVDFAEIERFMDQKLKNYSSGMQVRLAFSIATRAKADILLVDEVLAVGDADFQRKCFDYFRALKGAGKTVVFVTHDMNAVREYCDRAILIESSHLVEEGSASKVASSYTKMFIESATANADTGKVDRWGDAVAQYDSVEVIPKKVTAEDEFITIVAKVTAHKAVNKPIYGFLVKNATHLQLLGTNTTILKQQSPDLKAGEKYVVSWKVANVFNEGQYYIDPAIAYDSGSRTADWIEEATSFRVIRDDRTPYPVSPPIEVTVSKSSETRKAA